MALTPSQLEHYRRILTARRHELASATVRAESEVVEQEDLEHQDVGDRANADIAKDDLLQGASRDSGVLERIDDALARIANGSYGLCTVCGQEIPKSRLDAVPWATLCVRDQEIADKKNGTAGPMTGGAPSRVTL
jgi:DnaK suppressor protein